MRTKKEGGWRKDIEKLKEYIRLCEKYKQEIKASVQRINLEYEKEIIDYETYIQKLKYSLDNKSFEWWTETYDEHILRYEQEIEKREQWIKEERQREQKEEQIQKTTSQYTIATLIVLMLIAGLKLMSPTLTGLLVAENITMPAENITPEITIPENITEVITNITNITLPEIINVTIPEIMNITNITEEVTNITNITLEEKIIEPIHITPELIAVKTTFKAHEPVTLDFEFIKEQELVKRGIGVEELEEPKQRGRWISAEEEITTNVYDSSGALTAIQPEIEKERQGKFKITLPKPREFKAGLYTIKTELTKDGITYTEEQEFAWGVLAINTNKSVFLENEDAFIAMAVLDNQGHMVCDADLILTITSPTGQATTLTTANNDISISPECRVYGITNLPDYYTTYTVTASGTYLMTLTAITHEGIRTITDSFAVSESVDFDVSREAPTRIYPIAKYTTYIIINANTDYSGEIKEIVPASFDITPQEGLTIITINNEKILTWNKQLTTGTTTKLSYEFDAPDTSPEFYLLGPLTIGNWAEQRQWQIASDAPVNKLQPPLSIKECTEKSASGTCTLSNIVSSDANEESLLITGTSAGVYGRLNTSHTNDSLIPDDATLNSVYVCWQGYGGDGVKLGDNAADACGVAVGQNSTGTTTWYWVLSATQANCAAGNKPFQAASDVTDCYDAIAYLDTIAEAENALISIYAKDGDDKNIEMYVNWVYLNVTYTPAADTKTPTWDSNTTNASTTTRFGGNVSFGVNLQDENGLSYAYLSMNGSGTWRNYTLVSLGGVGSIEVNETNITRNTRDQYVCGKFWFNDTSNNANESNASCFIVANTPPTTPPTLSPADYTNITTNSQVLSCSGSTDADNDNINYEFYVNTTTDPTSLHQNTTTTTYTFTAPQSAAYYWRCRANDAFGESDYTTSRNLYIDLQAPQTNVSIYNNASSTTKRNYAVNWTANISDDMSLSYAWLEHNSTNRDNGLPKLFNESIFWLRNAKNYNISKQVTINVTRGNYTCARFWFNDTLNNKNFTDWSCFTIANTAPPTPSSITPASGNQTTNSISITCAGIGDADNDTIYYEIYGDTATTPTTLLQNTTTNTYNWDLTLSEIYYYRCRAHDGFDNSASYTSTNYRYVDLQAPQTNISVYNNATTNTEYGYAVNWTANISDDMSLSYAWLEHNATNRDNGLPKLFNESIFWLRNAKNYNVSQQITINVTRGNYTCARFWFNDTSSNVNKTDWSCFNVVDATTPTWNSSTNNASTITRKGGNVSFGINLLDETGLSQARLELNGSGQFSNYTIIQLSGKSTTLNLTNITWNTREQYVCGKYWFNDTSNNANESNASCFIVANTPPTTPSTLSPADYTNITTNSQQLSCSGSTDADTDTINYEFYVNTTTDPTSLHQNTTTTTYTFTATQSAAYYWRCRANDAYGESSYTTSRNLYTDFQAPQTNVSIYNNASANPEYSHTINWTANISDDMSLSYAWLEENATTTGANGLPKLNNQSIINLGNAKNYNVSQQITIVVRYGNYTCARFWFNDTSNNKNKTDWSCFNVVDATTPTWENIYNNASTVTRINGDVNWTANISDETVLSYAWLEHNATDTGANGLPILKNESIISISGINYNISQKITVLVAEENYTCARFWFNDTSNNINVTDWRCFTVAPELPAKSISVTGGINFGSGAVIGGNVGAWLYSDQTSSENGTWSWTAQEFIITNDGSQAGVITANASQDQEVWIGVGGDAFINGTESATNNGCSGNTGTFDRLNTTNAVTVCSNLLSGANNRVEADIKIYIPSDIPAGTEKWTNVTFYVS